MDVVKTGAHRRGWERSLRGDGSSNPRRAAYFGSESPVQFA